MNVIQVVNIKDEDQPTQRCFWAVQKLMPMVSDVECLAFARALAPCVLQQGCHTAPVTNEDMELIRSRVTATITEVTTI